MARRGTSATIAAKPRATRIIGQAKSYPNPKQITSNKCRSGREQMRAEDIGWIA